MRRRLIYLLCFVHLLGIGGCIGRDTTATDPISGGVQFKPITDSPTSTAPAAESFIARVNGQPISRTEFEKRVQQFQEAELENGLSSNQTPERIGQIQQQVLDGLIDQAIIEQAAQAQGVIVSDARLEQKITEMKAGQAEAEFQAWLALNSFTEVEFRDLLRSQLIAADLFTHIVAQAPTTTEQVHARQILVTDSTQAQTVLERLQAGENFADLAQQISEDENSRVNGGDLGWFPRGIHIVPPQVENVAFSLEPSQLSPVIESVLGYHIIKVELKDPNRPLTPQQLQMMQSRIFNEWLAQQRASAQIEDYLN